MVIVAGWLMAANEPTSWTMFFVGRAEGLIYHHYMFFWVGPDVFEHSKSLVWEKNKKNNIAKKWRSIEKFDTLLRNIRNRLFAGHPLDWKGVHTTNHWHPLALWISHCPICVLEMFCISPCFSSTILNPRSEPTPSNHWEGHVHISDLVGKCHEILTFGGKKIC